jgi:hypothetical protein
MEMGKTLNNTSRTPTVEVRDVHVMANSTWPPLH